MRIRAIMQSGCSGCSASYRKNDLKSVFERGEFAAKWYTTPKLEFTQTKN